MPVINGPPTPATSDPRRPDGDLEEHRGPLEGKTLAWIGDGNNVCASFIRAWLVLGLAASTSPVRRPGAGPASTRPRRRAAGPQEWATIPDLRLLASTLVLAGHLGLDG